MSQKGRGFLVNTS